MKKYTFLEIFEEHPDGSLSPRRTINVNGLTFGPGVKFNQGVAFGGINFHQYKYLDIATEEVDGNLSIRGFYRQ